MSPFMWSVVTATKITRGRATPAAFDMAFSRPATRSADHAAASRSHLASSAITHVFSGSGLSKLATVVAPLRPRAACRSIKRDPADPFGLDQPSGRQLRSSNGPATTLRGRSLLWRDCGHAADGRQNAGG